MTSHEVALVGREEVAEGTMQFRFARPAGFSFRAGQSVVVELPHPPAAPNSSRRIFSLCSAPCEAGLAIATRMRDGSAFKAALKALPLGSPVRLKGPRGTMTLHEDAARAAVFVAGGIGITPFLSMLRQAAHERADRDLLLLYSNRRPEFAAFLDELRSLAERITRFRLLARMTDIDGMLDAASIRDFVADAPGPLFYLAGPPGMVDGVASILTASGVRAEDVASEEFYGY